jgi:hypothetical protein
MRAILLTLLLLFSSTASAAVVEQVTRNNSGQPVIRILNQTPYYMNCYYRDQYNYYTFTLAPWTSSMWFMIYGQYQWQCR